MQQADDDGRQGGAKKPHKEGGVEGNGWNDLPGEFVGAPLCIGEGSCGWQLRFDAACRGAAGKGTQVEPAGGVREEHEKEFGR